MKKKIVIKYTLLFTFFFSVLLLFGQNNTDNIWNYGVSHAFRIGELPYRDYNSITTPLYQFIMSIGLFIYDSYLTFLVEQSILCLFLFYIIEKLVGKNVLFVFSLLLFPIFTFIFPNYNFLVMLLLFYLLYLEKNNKSDSLIGIVLGLLVLSKHTVGGSILLFSLLATKNRRKASTRLLFSLIPMLIFLVYLLITKTFINFLDLCLFGLFDFAESNNYFSLLFTSIMIAFLVYTIYSFIKTKDITNYYLLPAFTLLLPIVDMFHSIYFIAFFIVIIFSKKPFINQRIPDIMGIIFMMVFLLCNFFAGSTYTHMYLSSNGHMKYLLCDKERKTYIKKVLKKYNSYNHAYMLSMYSMYFDIESNNKITYFDIPLYGNFGYKGLDKMKKKINDMHDTYFFILDSKNRQYINRINKHVRNNTKYVDNIYDMEIYYKE